MANRIGETFGNYRLLSILGSGGFADVYLGENIHLGTKVAIKIIGKNGLSSEEIESFIKEAKTISLLDHPNIVKVLDFGIRDNIPYLVMDYMPGSLRQKHPKGTKIPEQVVVIYVKQLAGALQHAHDNGIIHRDVKPENVLLRKKTQELCLTDFGIAVQAQRTQSQTEKDIIGTLPYMSPDHFLGKVKKASDQYSLGIMTYEWFCGARPFEGDSYNLPYLHMHQTPPPFIERDTIVRPLIEEVVMRALAKKPEERFETIQQFADALEWATTHTASGHMTPLIGDFHPTLYSIAPTQLAVPFIRESESTIPAGLPVTHPITEVRPGLTERVTTSAVSKNRPVLTRRNMLVGIGSAAVVGLGITWWVKSNSEAHGTATTHGPSTQLTHVANRPTQVVKQELTFNIPSNGILALSPDGTKFATLGKSSNSQAKPVLEVRDFKTAKVFASYAGHSIIIQSIAWSPDGKRIASCGDTEQTIHIWDPINNKTTVFSDPDSASVVAWSPDNTKLVTASFGTIKIRDVLTGQILTTFNMNTVGGVFALAWAPNGSYIAAAGEGVELWFPNGTPFFTYGGHTNLVFTVAWSPNSQNLVSGGKDLTAQVWPASNTGSIIQIYKGHISWVDSVAWYPLTDKNLIVSGSADGIVQVWDAATGNKHLQYQGSSSIIVSVAWTPDGSQVVSLGNDGSYYVRNVPA